MPEKLYREIPVRRALTLAVRLSWRADRSRTAAKLALSMVDAVAFALEPVGIKMLVDAALRGDAAGAVRAVAVVAVLHAGGLLGDWWGFMIGMRLRESVVMTVDLRIIELTTGVPGVEHLERPDYADELLLLRTEREMFATILDAFGRNVGTFASVATTIGLLASIHPLLALLPLFGVPAVLTGARATKINQAAADAAAEPLRIRNFTYGLATKPAAGKELRVFGLGAELRGRHDQAVRALVDINKRAGLRSTAWLALGWLIFTAGYAGGVALVVIQAVDHQATLGQVVLATTLAARVNGQVSSVVALMNWLLGSLRGGRRLVWLEDYTLQRRRDAAGHGDLVPVPHRMTEGIVLDGVGFTYPGTDRPVLDGVTLRLPAGATIAVVGDNGAGKTTLVKLLSRFYEPTDGTILVDGVDLRRLPLDEWRSRMAAGFQDFARYELVARETVGVGDLAALDDDARVEHALSRASATDVPGDLPAGLDTLLGKSFDGGVEISGGQWQKLALGRSMMRETPLLLVLDEPTAALDAQTEHALFERFTDAARRAGDGAGAITIIVSHRFSTVRMADLIVVVGDGRITEAGSHAELMALGGTYAELYELQAAAYR